MSHFNLRCLRISDDDAPLVCATPTTHVAKQIEVIFVLDTSGSMYWAWPHLARSVNRFISDYTNNHISATVIQYARHVSIVSSSHSTYIPLREDFQYDKLDQSRDDIFLAFSNVKQHIQTRRSSVSDQLHFCVCFVADGGDTESGQNLVTRLSGLESSNFPSNIAFTTIACGPSFPTNTSIKLRTLFHDDEIVSVPLLTPVDNDPCDFEARFSEVIPHLLGESSRMVSINPPIRNLPWSDQTVSRVSQGSWFALDFSDVNRIRLDGTTAVLQDVECLREDLNAIGRQWVRYIQTLAAKGAEDVRAHAELALTHFKKLHTYVMQSAPANDNTASESSRCISRTLFELKLQMKKEKTAMYKTRTIMNELKSLATSALDNLTDEQLAQRLAIGTKESKYLEKAVRWKGALTVEGFWEARAHFKKLYTNLLPKLQACAGKDPFRSNVSLESNVDILTEKLFLDNLYDPVLSSQFMLIECFPVVGLGLKTYVSDGTTINPWLVRVDAVSRIVSCVDTASIYAMAESNTHAKISSGADEYEEVSAVCPLLVPETAAALGPILRSKLYQIVMTFQVTRNMDTVDKAAHLALLASLLTHLVKQAKSEWRDDLLNTVVFTASVLLERGIAVSKESDSMEKMTFVELLQSKPNIALVTAHPDVPKKCESVSKALLAYAVMMREKAADNSVWLKVWERIVAEYIGRAVQAEDPERSWEKWFILTGVRFQGSLSLENLLRCHEGSEKDMSRFASVPDARRFVDRFEVNEDEHDLTFSGMRFEMDAIKQARATSHGPVEWDNLVGFEANYLDNCGITGDERKVRSFVGHALKHSGSYERAIHEVQPWNDATEKAVATRLVKYAKSRCIREMKAELSLSAERSMTAFMRIAHEKGIVLPMTAEQIRQERKNRYGMETTEEDMRKMRYDEETGLCRAACQNNGCWRFLVADKNFAEHLLDSSATGGRPMIALHRTIQRLRNSPPEKIEGSVLSGCLARRDNDFVRQFNQERFSEKVRKQMLRIRAAYRAFEKQKTKL